MGLIKFFKNAFKDMKEDAKAQHEVDKANFNAVKAESKANFDEARAMGKRESRKKIMDKRRQEAISEAYEREQKAKAQSEEYRQ